MSQGLYPSQKCSRILSLDSSRQACKHALSEHLWGLGRSRVGYWLCEKALLLDTSESMTSLFLYSPI